MQTFSVEQGWNSEGNAHVSTILDVVLRGDEFVLGPLFFLLGIFRLDSQVFLPPQICKYTSYLLRLNSSLISD